MSYRNNIIIYVALCALFACTDKVSGEAEPYCLNEQKSCTADNDSDAYLTLQQPLQIEHPITINLQLPGDWQVEQLTARLVGANMQMGQIPIEFTPLENVNAYRGTLMIVACTRSDMVWRLEVDVESPQSDQRRLLHWSFSTEHME